MGISKKRGRKGGSAQAASNKFGHRKEMELFRIDNAPHQWRRGQAKRMDVFLGLIQSKVLLCACNHTHACTHYTVYAKALSILIYSFMHTRQAATREERAHLEMQLRSHPLRGRKSLETKCCVSALCVSPAFF